MLDVMRKPPPVVVPMTWIATRVRVPDTDRTVMIYVPEDEDDPSSGARLGMVTWWGEKPARPVEPKP